MTQAYASADAVDRGLRYKVFYYDGPVRAHIRQPLFLGYTDKPGPFIANWSKPCFVVDRRPYASGKQEFCARCGIALKLPHKGLRHQSDERIAFCSDKCQAECHA